MQPYPSVRENPHELIGVRPDETDPQLVMDRAARRIARIRAAGGSDVDVRRTLIATIIVARNDVLRRIAVRLRSHGGCRSLEQVPVHE